MKISLCMIVKNEESNLDECLTRIIDYVDEVVIVDTGSEEKTKEIALKYTDKVYDFEWGNDFSRARNFSISKAANQWILILDADEFVTSFDKMKLINIVNNNSRILGRLLRINEFERDGEIYRYKERISRFFNKNTFCYEGIIHEQVICLDEFDYSSRNIPIQVEHIGYQEQIISSKNKINRNIDLLLKALESEGSDSYINYQLGKSYYMMKDFNLSEKYFDIALEYVDNYSLEYVQDLVETYGYCLINQNKYLEALKLDELKKYYFNNPDYIFLMGLIFMNNGKFYKAIRYFSKCLEMKGEKMEGITSYKSNYNIGVIYEGLGEFNNAIKHYKLCRNYTRAEQRIKLLKQENSLVNYFK